jgi:hypothetical protein
MACAVAAGNSHPSELRQRRGEDIFGRAELLQQPRGEAPSRLQPSSEVMHPPVIYGSHIEIGARLSPQQAAQGFFFSAPFACGPLNPISSGVFFTNTTSFPRAKKLL